MQKLFNPAIMLMNRLRYPQKFLLISILFALPLILAITLLIREVEAKATFAEQERAGNTYLRSVQQLFDDALQEQVITHSFINGDTSLRTDVERWQTKIDTDLAALADIDSQLGATLHTTDSFNALVLAWQDLKNKQPNSRTRLSDDLHAVFIDNIRSLMILTANTSNLILDPNLDSYYIMDSVVLKLPNQQYLNTQVLLTGERIIMQHGFSADDKTQLIVLSGLLHSNIESISSGVDTAFRNNSANNARPALNVPLRAFISANSDLLAIIDHQMIDSSSITISSDLFHRSVNRALSTGFVLRDRTANVLDELLQARITIVHQQKNVVFIATGVILLVVLYIWIAFYLTVKHTVVGLDMAAQRMVNGDMDQAVRLESRDELGDVARAFNRVASALITSSTYQRAVLDNAIDGIITITHDGRIASFNRAAEQMFGYPADTIVGQTIHTLIPEPYAQQYQMIGNSREIVGRRQDASEFPLDMSISEMVVDDQHRFIAIVHDLTERKREAEQRARMQDAIIHAQAAALAELSTPLIPISAQIVVMPLIGAVDAQRAQQVLERLLDGVAQQKVRVAILDITGVPMVDTHIAHTLLNAARGIQLLGAQIILTGIRPEVAQTLVSLDIEFDTIVTHSTLEDGIAYANRKTRLSNMRHGKPALI